MTPMSVYVALKIFNLVCFYGYGFSCMFSQKMKKEFTRYGVPRHRVLTGALQVAGSTGMLAGFYFEPLTTASSLGLAVLMLLGTVVRFKIRDPILAILPAIFFMCLNFIIFQMSLNLGTELL